MKHLDPLKDTVDLRNVGRMFRELRVRQGIGVPDLAKRLSEMWFDLHKKEDRSLDWLFPQQRKKDCVPTIPNASTKIRQWEEGKLESELPIENVTPLTELLNVSKLTLYPFTGFHGNEAVSQSDVEMRATEVPTARYRFASQHLKGCDAMPVRVTIDRGGKSDDHFHGGDELLVVLSGEVDVVFSDNGTKASGLKQGDYVHFEAEQRHCVVNKREDVAAEVFVLRFDQCEGGLRSRARECLLEIVKNSNSEKFAKKKDSWEVQSGLLNSVAMQWYREEIADLQRRMLMSEAIEKLADGENEIPNGIMNPMGLMYFILSQGYSATDLSKRGLPSKIALGRFDQSLGKENLEELVGLKKGFKSEFFYPYAFPPIPRVVVVRRGTEDANGDYSSIVKTESKHFIPHRSLLGSLSNISIIEFPKDGGCQRNAHAGFELLIPLEGNGEVEVELKSGTKRYEISAQPFQYAFFDSSFQHTAWNAGDETLKILVVRVLPPLGSLKI